MVNREVYWVICTHNGQMSLMHMRRKSVYMQIDAQYRRKVQCRKTS